MNFAEAFQNFLSKITGQTDRLEAATAKLENALSSSAEVTAENARLKSENETLTGSLRDALAQKGTPEEAVKSAIGTERTRITDAVASGGLFTMAFDESGAPALSLTKADGFFALAPGADGKPALSLTDAGKVQFVNDEATRLAANAGHGHMPLKVDTNVLGNSGANAPKLTGRARLKAATRAEFEARKA